MISVIFCIVFSVLANCLIACDYVASGILLTILIFAAILYVRQFVNVPVYALPGGHRMHLSVELWVDTFCGSSLALPSALMSGVSASLVEYFYTYEYYGYGLTYPDDFSNLWELYYDMFIRLNYPVSLFNGCFLFKGLTVMFALLTIASLLNNEIHNRRL